MGPGQDWHPGGIRGSRPGQAPAGRAAFPVTWIIPHHSLGHQAPFVPWPEPLSLAAGRRGVSTRRATAPGQTGLWFAQGPAPGQRFIVHCPLVCSEKQCLAQICPRGGGVSAPFMVSQQRSLSEAAVKPTTGVSQSGLPSAGVLFLVDFST